MRFLRASMAMRAAMVRSQVETFAGPPSSRSQGGAREARRNTSWARCFDVRATPQASREERRTRATDSGRRTHEAQRARLLCSPRAWQRRSHATHARALLWTRRSPGKRQELPAPQFSCLSQAYTYGERESSPGERPRLKRRVRASEKSVGGAAPPSPHAASRRGDFMSHKADTTSPLRDETSSKWGYRIPLEGCRIPLTRHHVRLIGCRIRVRQPGAPCSLWLRGDARPRPPSRSPASSVPPSSPAGGREDGSRQP